MAIEIYQSNAGYLWVEDREIPLYNTQWIHLVSMNNDYITIINGDDIVIRNAPLRHIEDNSGNGYESIAAFASWWNTLLTNNSISFSSYTAYLTQTSTGAPVATILEDSISGLVWARTGAGTYTLTKVGAFPTGKTVPLKDYYTDKDGNSFELVRTSANVMTLKTYQASDGELADGVLTDQYFHIEVYI